MAWNSNHLSIDLFVHLWSLFELDFVIDKLEFNVSADDFGFPSRSSATGVYRRKGLDCLLAMLTIAQTIGVYKVEYEIPRRDSSKCGKEGRRASTE